MRNLLLAASRRTPPPVEVPYLQYEGVESLITGTALATAIGLSAGTAVNSTAGFLKFVRGGKTLYLAKMCLRRSVSWNNLDALGAVVGTRRVTIGGNEYMVKLPTGSLNEAGASAGGDWNELMYAVCSARPVNYEGPVLADFTPAELFVGDGSNARSSLCRETQSTNSTNCIRRGRDNLTYYAGLPKSDAGTLVYWRPLLELVE